MSKNHRSHKQTLPNQDSNLPRPVTETDNDNGNAGESPLKLFAWLWGVPAVIILAAIAFRAM